MSDHSSLVAHQFDSLEQQRESESLGMWVFLVTEVMFFGGLFAIYAVYRYMYPHAYEEVSKYMDVFLGTLNTGVLLTSSFSMVMAVHYCREGKKKALLFCLMFTIACALAFLVIKGVEYHHKYEHGMMIGSLFHHEGVDAPKMHLVLCLYFFMTGLHAFHIIIGIGVLSWLVYLAFRNKVNAERYMAVELTGLYWHFVDLVWVFLFPLFYLVHTR